MRTAEFPLETAARVPYIGRPDPTVEHEPMPASSVGDQSPSAGGPAGRPRTYLTVTYAAEVGLLKLQARSFARFVPPALVERIAVIVNEVEAGAVLAAIEADVMPEFGPHAAKVELIPANALMTDRVALRGWRRQQSLKLLYARRTDSAKYIVLDSKNHFIRPVTDNTFVDKDGRGRTFRTAQRGSLMPYFMNSLKAFGLDGEAHVDGAMPATTPYVLDSATVREMLDEIEEREGQAFEAYFHTPGRDVTEFFLYYAFLLKTGRVDALHHFGARNAATLFTRWPDTVADLEQVLEKARQPSTVMFGLHKNRVAQLTEPHRARVVALWVEAGLFTDAATADAYLSRLQAEIAPDGAAPARSCAPSDDLSQYFHKNKWGGPDAESLSGKGSTLRYTEQLRGWLPGLLRRLNVETLLDAPCGDFNWMKAVELGSTRYIGMDIVADLIADLEQAYASPERRFLVGDITRGDLPAADLMLCRDCLFHLPYEYDWRFLENFARSGIPHLLTTSHLGRNRDIERPGQWRQLNLMTAPFHLPPPLEQVDDWIEGHPRRIVGLWSAEQIQEVLRSSGRRLAARVPLRHGAMHTGP